MGTLVVVKADIIINPEIELQTIISNRFSLRTDDKVVVKIIQQKRKWETSSDMKFPIQTIVLKIVLNSPNSLIFKGICGDGRTRTAVQTNHPKAFYTLSLFLFFIQGLPTDRLP